MSNDKRRWRRGEKWRRKKLYDNNDLVRNFLKLALDLNVNKLSLGHVLCVYANNTKPSLKIQCSKDFQPYQPFALFTRKLKKSGPTILKKFKPKIFTNSTYVAFD